MSDDNGKTKKKIRRGDRTANEARTARNKKRRAVKQAKIEAAHAAKRTCVVAL